MEILQYTAVVVDKITALLTTVRYKKGCYHTTIHGDVTETIRRKEERQLCYNGYLPRVRASLLCALAIKVTNCHNSS